MFHPHAKEGIERSLGCAGRGPGQLRQVGRAVLLHRAPSNEATICFKESTPEQS